MKFAPCTFCARTNAKCERRHKRKGLWCCSLCEHEGIKP